VVIERGEAVFHVAKDRNRPFVVAAAGTRVQAVGTVFSVASNAETVVVTVTEGRVKVTPAGATIGGAGREREILLGANERVSVSAQGIARPVRRIEVAPTPEWGDNQVVFENTRVADVVARFNRHNRVQIRIDDEVLATRTVSGVFAVDDPRSFVEFLQSVAGAAGTDNGSDEIVVSSTRTGATFAVPPR
jgi:transmembrane sensor